MAYFHSPTIVTNGLVLCLDSANTESYPGSGTAWTDLSGNGNNGTLVNGPVFDGTNMGSISFDGVDDVGTLGNNMYTYTYDSSYTVDVFLKINSLSRVNGIIGDLQFDWWSFRVNSNNNLLIRHRLNDSIQNQLVGNTSLNSNQYYHCVGVFNKSSGMQLFINGQLDGQNTSTVIFGLNSSGRGPKFIGQNRTGVSTSPQVLDGSIYSVKLYNRALSAAEILQNYNATKGRFGL
jgi:hypothetical protein